MINQEGFVRLLAERENIQIQDARRVLQSTLDLIVETLPKEEVINFSSFGKFKINKSPAHRGYNPVTDEEMWVDDVYSPHFKASKTFKVSVSNAYKK